MKHCDYQAKGTRVRCLPSRLIIKILSVLHQDPDVKRVKQCKTQGSRLKSIYLTIFLRLFYYQSLVNFDNHYYYTYLCGQGDII